MHSISGTGTPPNDFSFHVLLLGVQKFTDRSLQMYSPISDGILVALMFAWSVVQRFIRFESIDRVDVRKF